ncbi:hypothetical protein ACP6H9_22075 [Vibrio harveyi]|uniref:hypothetical protein n=1 Tax=Vibrio harveyi TaxID=669 RepID=UPI00215C1141|nr:hypothetical protein [Vibrio harveyi]MCR9772592.1 hypothetical protein [Vibrio harveyi]
MNYEFSNEAKERIRSIAQAEITSFIEELPQSVLRAVFKALPKVDGFRRNSIAEFKEKQKRLIMHLTFHGSSKVNPEWTVFGKIWELWAKENLGIDLPEVDEKLDDFQIALSFFNKLGESYPNLSREDAEKLYRFSCFVTHEQVNSLISSFKKKADIKRDRMVMELPQRLKVLESNVKKIESSCRDLEALHLESEVEFDSIEEKLNQAKAISEETTAELKVASLSISDNERSLRDVEDRLNSVEALQSKSKRNASVLSDANINLQRQLENIEAELKRKSQRGPELDSMSEAIQNLETRIDNLVHQDDLATIRGHLDEVYRKVNCLDSLCEDGDSPNTSRQAKTSSMKLKNLADETVYLSSIAEACEVLAANLQVIGFTKSETNLLSRKILAGVLSGQVIQFSGSLADLTCDAVSAAIGGSKVLEWAIPVGLVDSISSEEFISSSVSNDTCCAVMKGVNLSAFEVYGAPIREEVIRRQCFLPCSSQAILLATITQGPAAFPDGGAITEIGPLFNTDELRIRLTPPRSNKFVFGKLDYESILNEVDRNVSADQEDLDEVIKDTSFHGGNLWARCVSRAYKALRSVPGGNEESDLHTILLNWTLPWAIVSGTRTDGIKQVLEQESSTKDHESIVR